MGNQLRGLHSRLTDVKEVRKFFVIFYVVGLLGMMIPYSRTIFMALTPYSLLLGFVYLAFFHTVTVRVKDLIVFVAIAVSGLVIEIIGVQTGAIFGNYQYGHTLGIKIVDTPVIIGLNWLFLAYASSSVLVNWAMPQPVKVVLSSAIMLGYDWVLEHVAPTLHMWYWQNQHVPMQNYVAWFAVALVFNSTIAVTRTKTQNPLALVLLVGQFLFFVVLSIVL